MLILCIGKLSPAIAMKCSEIIASSSLIKNCNDMKDDCSIPKLLSFLFIVDNFYDL